MLHQLKTCTASNRLTFSIASSLGKLPASTFPNWLWGFFPFGLSWLPGPANSMPTAWCPAFPILGSLTIEQSSAPDARTACTLDTRLSGPCLVSPASGRPHLVGFYYYIWRSGEQIKLFRFYSKILYFCYLYMV